MDLEYPRADYQSDHGVVNIVDIEAAFLRDWKDQVYFDFMSDATQLLRKNKIRGLVNARKHTYGTYQGHEKPLLVTSREFLSGFPDVDPITPELGFGVDPD